MKKLFALSAIAAAFVGTSVQAGDLATVYGKLNVTVENMETPTIQDNGTLSGDDAWKVNSNASRFGVKGEVDLGAGLAAIYTLEWEVDVADKSGSDNLKSRNQFVGLKGGFGQVIFGRHDTPLKASQGKVDLFGNLLGDIKHIMPGENRVNNIIYYATPTIAGGLVGHLALVPGEKADGEDNGLADAISAAITYDANGIYAAVAYDKDVGNSLEVIKTTDSGPIAFISGQMDTLRLTTAYKTDIFQVGLLYQTSEASDELSYYDITGTVGNDFDDVSLDSVVLSGYYKIDAVKLKAQYGWTDVEIENSDDKLKTLSVGVDYALGKKTTAGVFYTQNELDDVDGAEESTFGFGLEHKF